MLPIQIYYLYPCHNIITSRIIYSILKNLYTRINESLFKIKKPEMHMKSFWKQFSSHEKFIGTFSELFQKKSEIEDKVCSIMNAMMHAHRGILRKKLRAHLWVLKSHRKNCKTTSSHRLSSLYLYINKFKRSIRKIVLNGNDVEKEKKSQHKRKRWRLNFFISCIQE